MISVIEVYNNLRDYCNKDQKGFVTPSVFNSFAGLAQQQIFNSMFSALPEALNAKRKGIDPSREKSLYKQIQEDLAYFVEKSLLFDTFVPSLDSNDEFVDPEAAIFKKPSDLSKIISISLDDNNRTSAELLYDVEKIDRILKSNLSTPTDDFPVALIGKNIELFPSSLTSILLTYYRQPRSTFVIPTAIGESDFAAPGDTDKSSLPSYAVNLSEVENFGDLEIADPGECRDFELPEHYKNQLVTLIASFIGVSLRDEFLINKTAS